MLCCRNVKVRDSIGPRPGVNASPPKAVPDLNLHNAEICPVSANSASVVTNSPMSFGDNDELPRESPPSRPSLAVSSDITQDYSNSLTVRQSNSIHHSSALTVDSVPQLIATFIAHVHQFTSQLDRSAQPFDRVLDKLRSTLSLLKHHRKHLSKSPGLLSPQQTSELTQLSARFADERVRMEIIINNLRGVEQNVVIALCNEGSLLKRVDLFPKDPLENAAGNATTEPQEKPNTLNSNVDPPHTAAVSVNGDQQRTPHIHSLRVKSASQEQTPMKPGFRRFLACRVPTQPLSIL